MGLLDWLVQQHAQQYSPSPVPEQTPPPTGGPSTTPWTGLSNYLPTIEPGYQGGSPIPFSLGMPPAFRGQPSAPQLTKGDVLGIHPSIMSPGQPVNGGGGNDMPDFSGVMSGVNGSNLPPRQMVAAPNKSIIQPDTLPTMSGAFSQLLPSSGSPIDMTTPGHPSQQRHGLLGWIANHPDLAKLIGAGGALGLSAAFGGKQGFLEGAGGLSQGMAQHAELGRKQDFERSQREEDWRQRQAAQKSEQEARAGMEQTREQAEERRFREGQAGENTRLGQQIAAQNALQGLRGTQELAQIGAQGANQKALQQGSQTFQAQQNTQEQAAAAFRALAQNPLFAMNPEFQALASKVMSSQGGGLPTPPTAGGKPPVGATAKAKDGTPVRWNGEAWEALKK